MAFFSTILIATASFYYVQQSKPKSTTVPSGFAVAEPKTIVQRVTLAGHIEPQRFTTISAPFDGFIKAIHVQLGQHVQKGDPLFTLVQSLQTSEESHPLKAPFSGTIVQLLKTEGQHVKVAADPTDFILRMDDLRRLFVTASAPEIDIVKVKKGQRAVVKAAAILTRQYEAIVRDIALASTMKQSWGNRAQIEYQVKMEILDPDTQLKSGMSALVDIVTGEKQNVVSLRHEFIHLDGESPFVILRDGSRKAITLGIQNEELSEVASGLDAGTAVKQVNLAAEEG